MTKKMAIILDLILAVVLIGLTILGFNGYPLVLWFVGAIIALEIILLVTYLIKRKRFSS